MLQEKKNKIIYTNSIHVFLAGFWGRSFEMNVKLNELCTTIQFYLDEISS